MHRNTGVIFAILSVVAALLIGVNVGRKLNGKPPSPQPTITPSITPSPGVKTYTHPRCQVSLEYPPEYSVTEASDSAVLARNNNDRIILLCGVDFPKPPLSPERIEEATVAGLQATIYHDASAKDGTSLDVVVFSHPKNGLEVALFGFGEVFKKVIQSLKLE